MELKQIGTIHTPFAEPAGVPIQPRYAAGSEGTVEVFEPFVEGLRDLSGFERIWLVYWFHRAPPARLVVHPFKDDADHGLFATRAPCRPNPIGMSAVRLLSIEGGTLRIGDVDILDGTPLVDIKPYVPEFDHYDVQRIGWMARAGDRTTADDRFADRKE